MKTTNILSSRLPHLNQAIKECVNLGYWLLFTMVNKEYDEGMVFYIKNDRGVFVMSNSGEILREVDNKNYEIATLYYFSDLIQPLCLSQLSPA